MQEGRVRYKNPQKKRFIIIYQLHPDSTGKSIILGAYNIDNAEETFAELVIKVDKLAIMQALLDESNEQLDNFLIKYGLRRMQGKININSSQHEIIELKFEEISNIDRKLELLELPEDIYRRRIAAQNDILACAYKHMMQGTNLKQMVDYVWCDTDLLLSELRYLSYRKLISTGRLSREEIEAGGVDNEHSLISLTAEGKRVYEETMDKTGEGFMQPTKDWVSFASNEIVFLAHRFIEQELVTQVKEALNKQSFQYREGKVEHLGYITEDILAKIKESSFFLALITPADKFEKGKFSTSSWILMEIGVAIAYERKVAILAEDCVEQEEYARKLQPDAQYEVFKRENFKEALDKVIKRIVKEREKHKQAVG